MYPSVVFFLMNFLPQNGIKSLEKIQIVSRMISR